MTSKIAKIDWSTVELVGKLKPVVAGKRESNPRERRGRSSMKAILSGASMKARSCGALTHTQLCAELVSAYDCFIYGIGLLAAACAPTRDQQVEWAACAMVETMIALHSHSSHWLRPR